MTNRQIQAEKTRRRIIAVTFDLLKDRSFESLKISEICNAASVSVGSFYHYFKSKEELLIDSINAFDYNLVRLYKKETHEYSLEKIYSIFRISFEQTARQGSNAIAALYVRQLTKPDDYHSWDPNRTLNQLVYKELEMGMNKEEFYCTLDSFELGNWLLLVFHGVIYNWCLRRGRFDLVERGMKEIDFALTSALTIPPK